MSWKKSIFSCLMWVIYLLIIGTAMAFTGSAVCGAIGVAEYIGGIVAVAYLPLAGLIVFALRKTAAKLKDISYSRGNVFLWIEGILAVVLFAAGLFLRAKEMQTGVDGSVFFDLAYVSSDAQDVPQLSHGAAYLYVWALRLIFILLGNKAAVAFGLQIVLQMLGVLILYFAVRKMAGRVSAITMLVFFMLSSYMVEKVIVLSPEMFYLLLFSIALLYASRGVDRAFGWLFWLSAGVMAALLTYLDVAGLLLIPLMIGVIVTKRKGAKRKLASRMLGFVSGLFFGAMSCVLVDALCRSESVLGTIEAWARLYSWGAPKFAIAISDFDTILVTLLLCLMAWGIFSPWRGRKAERFSIWIICLLAAALMQCLGIFTEEMSGAIYIFFFSTILAGLSVKMSVAVPEAESSEKGSNEKKAIPSDFELEELGGDEEEQEESVAGEDQKLKESYAEKETDETQTEEKQDRKKSDAGGETDRLQPEEKGTQKESEDRERIPVKDNQSAGEKKETVEADKRSEEKLEQQEKQEKQEQKEPEEKREIEYIENPLPLPKKHVKRVMDYALDSKPDTKKDLDDYDIYVPDDDDFDH